MRCFARYILLRKSYATLLVRLLIDLSIQPCCDEARKSDKVCSETETTRVYLVILHLASGAQFCMKQSIRSDVKVVYPSGW